jgi:hypothetical protein
MKCTFCDKTALKMPTIPELLGLDISFLTSNPIEGWRPLKEAPGVEGQNPGRTVE